MHGDQAFTIILRNLAISDNPRKKIAESIQELKNTIKSLIENSAKELTGINVNNYHT